MKIGHFVPVVSRLPGYERNVSGHIQTPLHAIQLLADAGHEVHLITNTFGSDRVLPWCMPTSATVHYVRDSRRRLGSLEKKRPPVSGVYPIAFLRQVAEIKRIVRREHLEVLHVHGHLRTAQFAALLKMLGLGVPTVATLFNLPARPGLLGRTLLRRAGPIVTATESLARRCRALGAAAHVIRHGIVRDLLSERDDRTPAPRQTRVLFWRDLTRPNGADIALAAFDRLAGEFPDLSFDFAVRPQITEVQGVEEVCRRHENVHLHRFPYPPGISLAGLLAESLVVLLPFRGHTVQPQLAIAESLAAGVPVVASNLESTDELIDHGETGMIVPVDDVEATIEAVRKIISRPEEARHMGCRAAAAMARTWTWDAYVRQIEKLYRSVI